MGNALHTYQYGLNFRPLGLRRPNIYNFIEQGFPKYKLRAVVLVQTTNANQKQIKATEKNAFYYVTYDLIDKGVSGKNLM